MDSQIQMFAKTAYDFYDKKLRQAWQHPSKAEEKISGWLESSEKVLGGYAVKAVAGAQGLYDVVLAVTAVPHAALRSFTAVVHEKSGVQIHCQHVPISGPPEYE